MAIAESPEGLERLLGADPAALQAHILRVLHARCGCESLFETKAWNGVITSSSVMLLLGRLAIDGLQETCVILNKRSRHVRQAGDLCCPGGRVEAELDPYLARILELPLSPLTRWPHWSGFRARRPEESRLLSLLLATSLRESWEEMRLNPLFIRFLGPLPSQRLLLFRMIIHPMVGWVSWQKRFVPSWEVEKIIAIPLRLLVRPIHYARYRLVVPPHLEAKFGRATEDYLCFLYPFQDRTELLWGATLRIILCFLELVFGFTPPGIESLPLVPGVLSEAYIHGSGSDANGTGQGGER